MNEIAIYGLIILAALAIIGLGVKLTLNYKGGTKNSLKKVTINGPYAGRDNRGVDTQQDQER